MNPFAMKPAMHVGANLFGGILKSRLPYELHDAIKRRIQKSFIVMQIINRYFIVSIILYANRNLIDNVIHYLLLACPIRKFQHLASR